MQKSKKPLKNKQSKLDKILDELENAPMQRPYREFVVTVGIPTQVIEVKYEISGKMTNDEIKEDTIAALQDAGVRGATVLIIAKRLIK